MEGRYEDSRASSSSLLTDDDGALKKKKVTDGLPTTKGKHSYVQEQQSKTQEKLELEMRRNAELELKLCRKEVTIVNVTKTLRKLIEHHKNVTTLMEKKDRWLKALHQKLKMIRDREAHLKTTAELLRKSCSEFIVFLDNLLDGKDEILNAIPPVTAKQITTSATSLKTHDYGVMVTSDNTTAYNIPETRATSFEKCVTTPKVISRPSNIENKTSTSSLRCLNMLIG